MSLYSSKRKKKPIGVNNSPLEKWKQKYTKAAEKIYTPSKMSLNFVRDSLEKEKGLMLIDPFGMDNEMIPDYKFESWENQLRKPLQKCTNNSHSYERICKNFKTFDKENTDRENQNSVPKSRRLLALSPKPTNFHNKSRKYFCEKQVQPAKSFERKYPKKEITNSRRPYKVEPSIKPSQKGSQERLRGKKKLTKNPVLISNSNPGWLFKSTKDMSKSFQNPSGVTLEPSKTHIIRPSELTDFNSSKNKFKKPPTKRTCNANISHESDEVLQERLSNVFISSDLPTKDREVKIKVNNTESSLTSTYRSSIIPAEIQMTTLMTDSDEEECTCCKKCKACSNYSTNKSAINSQSCHKEEQKHEESFKINQAKVENKENIPDFPDKKDLEELCDEFIRKNKENAIKNNSKTLAQNNMINIENVILLEEKMRLINENVLKMKDLTRLCEDWWEISHTETMLQNLGNVFKEPRYKAILRTATCVEICAISLIFAVDQHYETPPKSILMIIKNIAQCTYENYLNIIGLVINRLPPDSVRNIWVQALEKILSLEKSTCNKQALFNLIQKNNIVLTERCRKLCLGKYSVKQLALKRGISEEKLLRKENCDISRYISPLCQTLLITVEEILNLTQSLDITKTRENMISILEGFSETMKMKNNSPMCVTQNISESSFEEDCCEVMEPPYLPPISLNKTYTLVLDLDETLVHYFEIGDQGKFLVRPGVIPFLKEMSKFFEIVIFTAAVQDYADWAIDQIDTVGYISHRLYRQHTLPCGSVNIKDLSRIGRDLKKVIIVDNIPENFQLQQDNGIFITSWFDDVTDTALCELSVILKDIFLLKADDLRDALRNYEKH
ncbi:unnamed protein product [Moneuplotes crassus]|uniref:FCP1 homology domain-containing protein n=1 Tax=Euplotes crassus TaxID=5936 RepID=A0AAD1Y0S9_EUPCR|nr:unnamed protein product [Moneuplotes crassus]